MKWTWIIVALVILLWVSYSFGKKETTINTEPSANETATTKSVETAPATSTISEVKSPAVREIKTTVTSAEKLSGNIVEYTESGFEPSVLTIKRGESVEFVNIK